MEVGVESQLFKFRAWTRSGIDNASARDRELALIDAELEQVNEI